MDRLAPQVSDGLCFLFVSEEPRPDDPLYPFKQYYEAASHSFEAFLNIRYVHDLVTINIVPRAACSAFGCVSSEQF